MSEHIKSGRLAVLLIITITLTALVSSASVQHHPFSELFPADVDLNFGGKDVENVSDVQAATLSPSQSDIEFKDTGEVTTLQWDNSVGEWRLNGVNLNLDSNNITNFFGSPCVSGEVVANVNDDGSFQCVNVSSEVSGDFVSRTGDSMNGNLDMIGNNINDVSTINDNGNPLSTGGNIVSSGKVRASNSIETGSGVVTTSGTGMCIGDQC